MERDYITLLTCDQYRISTHTLTWSVTDGAFNVGAIKYISTHTLTWSVTDDIIKAFISVVISTHTLTWSVTPN